MDLIHDGNQDPRKVLAWLKENRKGRGLLDFLEDGNMIAYSPGISNIDNTLDLMIKLWS
jgi:hypothetical protein